MEIVFLLILVLLLVYAEVLFLKLTKLDISINKLIKGDNNMATTLADLDAAIAAETTENATLLTAVTQLDTDVTALIAKVVGGQDFTTELNAVNANLASITGVVASAAAEDAAVQGQITPPPA